MSDRITVYYTWNEEGYQLVGYSNNYYDLIWLDFSHPTGQTSEIVASATFKDNCSHSGVAIDGLKEGIINNACRYLIH
jgi:hypothetical protein